MSATGPDDAPAVAGAGEAEESSGFAVAGAALDGARLAEAEAAEAEAEAVVEVSAAVGDDGDVGTNSASPKTEAACAAP